MYRDEISGSRGVITIMFTVFLNRWDMNGFRIYKMPPAGWHFGFKSEQRRWRVLHR